MKYLKKFNEELDPMTYKRAAYILDKIEKESPSKGKALRTKERSDALRKHADTMEKKVQFNKWKEKIEEFKQFGEFDFTINGETSSFYIVIIPEIDSTVESWEDESSDNRTIIFSFAVGIIPTTEEQYHNLSEYYIGNGFIWAMWLMLNYKVENSEVIFDGIKTMNYEIGDFNIANRKTANKIKKLLSDIFGGMFYPSGYTDVDNAYDKIEQGIIQGLDVAIDYGIDMERVKEDILKLKYSDFYIAF